MIEGLSDTTLLRIGIGLFFVVVLLVVILVSSRNRQAQGKRVALAKVGEGEERMEPTLREIIESEHKAAGGSQDGVDSAELAAGASHEGRAGSQLGSRPGDDYDKIVSVYLVARAGQSLSGPDLVVAAEKAGLVYGNMNIFHRMVDNHPQLGPIFSVANLVKPGYFDLRAIKELQTPGVNFFITLPGPMSALDAWDALLPTAQRMAELLDAVLLDEERNALGRQRIANIRDELRVYDRAREKLNIRPGH
jgi:cell division protein ZipA